MMRRASAMGTVAIDLDGSRRKMAENVGGPKVETPEFVGMVRRCIRAAGRRVAAGDVSCLNDLANLQVTLDDAIRDAVGALRAAPWNYSWEMIGDNLGVTKQAAQQRFGR